jgi:hypothetical protein
MDSGLPLKKTIVFLVFLSTVSFFGALYIQLSADKTASSCSYLDPVTVDIAAFAGGLFLVIESLVDIAKHCNASLRQQLSRCCRNAFGFSVIAIHIVQFIHK